MRIVFLGSSVFAQNRDQNDPKSLGNGFIKLLDDYGKEHNLNLEIYNLGVNGEIVKEHLERIEEVTSLKPDLLFYSISTNDATRELYEDKLIDDKGLLDDFEKIINKAISNNIKVCVIEPFIIAKKNYDIVFLPKIDLTREYAKKHHIDYLETNGFLNKLGTDYAIDGIHPSAVGNKLLFSMIKNYLESVMK